MKRWIKRKLKSLGRERHLDVSVDTIVSVNALRPFKTQIDCANRTCGCRVSNFLWISHKLSLIYIETPKCGCTTVKAAFGIALTHEMQIEAYLRRLGQTSETADSPVLTLDGYGNSFPLSVFKTSRDRIMKSIASGLKESHSIGKFEFRHSYDTVENLLNRFPTYEAICIVRDPIKRFLSALDMFYSPNSRPSRRLQRMSHSPMVDTELDDINKIVDDIFLHPNHHFMPIANFCEGQINGSIKFIDIKDLDSFLKRTIGEAGLGKRCNITKRYNFKPDMISPRAMDMIREFYSVDLRVEPLAK